MGSLKRIDYLDIAKGFLIISVVLSHSEFEYAPMIYWFHMPAFFIISGMLFKDGLNLEAQIKKFFLPYLTFSLVDMAFTFLAYPQDLSLENVILYGWRHIYSGKAIPGVFWFVPCLFLTKVIFNYGKKYIKKPYFTALIVLLYLAGHAYSLKVIPDAVENITTSMYLPWNIDVLMVAIPYYAIGYVMNDCISIITKKSTFLISLILCVVFYELNLKLGIYYFLNLKFSEFKFVVLDLVVPLIFTICIISFSSILVEGRLRRFLLYTGKNSLIVMYLHKPLESFLLSKVNFGYITYTIIGTLIPVLFSLIIVDRHKIAQLVFKGKGIKVRYA
ncbi:acyltransferase [Clostridium polyendosporum]|uniref:Acyltransferase n=1 Tax=Clostridium polyendosporum TaxID=69208 RepID=A0A919RYQ4_9CLOT|nr:acyltransferase family protein [Clostridium polyendosporum]GIM28719.1 acyltransferase [Clostridium polyendosporum]